MSTTNQKITTFLMFEGKAEEAMNFYTSLFDRSEIVNISRYDENGPGKEGSVIHATFMLHGQEFMCIDSYVNHNFTFTPAMSLYVTCDTEEEIETAFNKLAKEGAVLMPLGAYPFSKKFGWLNDKYGVSWQLTLAE
ncbi:VOC family protein [Bacillus sp. GX]|uniref:VOC family protein n=1 Tax=Bacillus albus TaxID=2026189 RepID=A0A1J9U3G7_9BACI|nr:MULTISPECIES: VOC family protein [Bacillus]PFB81240.1 VOC family protein [Bacillus anthracis]PFM47292.1 VOC family protein [Bacillus cereus]AZQ47727.1 VOC family protein [Bacillus albus]MBF7153944.1 VOC family protein [Bacillus albus]MDA2215817.1 VOC family protein [Bacillus cereus group sp. Bc228]